ncbi:outer membrane protein assembly factor BamD [Marinobacteraceae bacterium S3BR75-40.1]
MRTALTLALLALLAALFTGCASTPEKVLPEKTYYEQASEAMQSGNFNEASENLEALETYYPFGRYAEQAQLDLIYARYQNLDLEGSRRAADRYLRLHPQSEHADYALYVRGLASYYLDIGLAERYFALDVNARAPGEQRQALRDFSKLLDQFPNSDYAPDARQRMIAIRNRLAGQELVAARYYIKRQAYVAALNRARYVVENYPQSPAVEDALTLMVELNRLLGMPRAADNALTMLAINFPDSQAFNANMHFVSQQIKPETRSLTSAVTFGLFEDEEEDSVTVEDLKEPTAPAPARDSGPATLPAPGSTRP